MNRLVILGVAVIAVLYVIFSSLFVVNEREQAIKTRFGEIVDVYEEPGIYFKLPTTLVENVQIIEDRLLRYDLEDITLQVSGGKFYEVDAFLTYRITDPVRFRQTVLGSLQLADQRINTRFESALRRVYGLREFNAALSQQRSEMMREARDLIREDMEELGIEIVDVRILRTDLTQQVSQQTFDRMSAERLAEAARLRARGQEQAQTLRAIADRQAVEIVSGARRDAEILRGEGDAQRNKVFADAFSQDEEFFEFYRSMQSYREALASQGTTMLLSPDSEFFEYFRATGEGSVSASQTGAARPIEVPQLLEEPGTMTSSEDTELPSLDDATPSPQVPEGSNAAPVDDGGSEVDAILDGQRDQAGATATQ